MYTFLKNTVPVHQIVKMAATWISTVDAAVPRDWQEHSARPSFPVRVSELERPVRLRNYFQKSRKITHIWLYSMHFKRHLINDTLTYTLPTKHIDKYVYIFLLHNKI